MQYDTKIRLDPEMVAAIDFARRQESDLPPRAEMIRRLLGKALAANLKQLGEAKTPVSPANAKRLPVLERELGRVFGKPKK